MEPDAKDSTRRSRRIQQRVAAGWLRPTQPRPRQQREERRSRGKAAAIAPVAVVAASSTPSSAAEVVVPDPQPETAAAASAGVAAGAASSEADEPQREHVVAEPQPETTTAASAEVAAVAGPESELVLDEPPPEIAAAASTEAAAAEAVATEADDVSQGGTAAVAQAAEVDEESQDAPMAEAEEPAEMEEFDAGTTLDQFDVRSGKNSLGSEGIEEANLEASASGNDNSNENQTHDNDDGAAPQRPSDPSTAELPSEIQVQLRASVFVYGPFAAPEVIRDHCYTDYLELCGGGDGSPLSFEDYQKHYAAAFTKLRSQLRSVTMSFFKGSRNLPILPTLPAFESPSAVRTLAFNLHWMIQTSTSDGKAYGLHPCLVEVVRRGMYWHNASNSFDALDEYLKRVNDRVARTDGPGAKPVTLHGLAPLIVATIAVTANIGIASHLGLGRHRNLPPLTELYYETVRALNDRDGPLGKKFAKASRALLDKLRGESGSVASVLSGAYDVPRDSKFGLPTIAFIKYEE
ncbi:hypothetical protein H9P43_006253 [Blastocladiella emersonii ATCC 22665]|nr:hypothetical protein H9P43_006253 [Blastocladiella emersonii ATCC 22665]